MNSFLLKKNYKNIIFQKITMVTKKKKYFPLNNSSKNYRENQYSINKKLLKTITANRALFKHFFLKKFSRQKKITNLTQHFSKKKQYIHYHFNSYLFFILLRSHFFFFLDDVNFFLKKNFVTVNGVIVKNKFFELKQGDCVQIVNSNQYFDYIYNIYNFFKNKIKKIKYKKWKGLQKKKVKGTFFKIWLPNFLDKFVFYRNEIPKFLEVDFFSLSIIYLYKTNNILENDIFFMKIFSSYFIKMYNWRIK